MKRTLPAFMLGLSLSIGTGTILAQGFSESFADITTLPGSGWVLVNQSSGIGAHPNGWFQGNVNAFPSVDGVTGEYIGSNFNAVDGVLGGADVISCWLVTPVVTLENGGILTFYTRTTPDDVYPDRLEVRLSTNGSSTNTGVGPTGVGDFSTTLLTINQNLQAGVQAYPLDWTQYMIVISGLPGPVTGRFAFRYFVTNAGPNGTNSDYIGIDEVVYTPNCTITPPAGAISENEPCGQDLNGGCNSLTPVFVDLAPGCTTTYTGTVHASGGSRDTDWYRFTLNSPATVTVSLDARFPNVVGFTNGLCGTSMQILNIVEGNPCTPNVVSYTFNTPGTYHAVVLPSLFDGLSCNSGVNNYNVTFTITPTPPTITPGGPTTFCQGDSVQLSSSLSSGNIWSTGATSQSIYATTPGAYTVSGPDAAPGCAPVSAPVNITVNALPTVTANANPSTACNGTSVTLTGSGAQSYTWDNGVQDGVAFTPSQTDTYVVTGTDANGCSNTDTITIPVGTNPSVTITPSANAICDGDMLTLTASGAVTYVWDNGVQNGQPFPVQPLTYKVIGYNADGCTDTVYYTPTVFPNPTVTINASSTSVCDGDSVMLSGSGAPTMVWNHGVQDGQYFIPAPNTTYVVVGTDGNGCSGSDSITINVNQLPVVSLNLPMDSICANAGPFALSGALPSGGSFSGTGVTGGMFDPTVGPGTYTIDYVYTDANGCTGSATDQLVVYICLGVETVTSEAAYGPNPTSGLIQVELPGGWADAEIRITDIQGRLLEIFRADGNRFEKDMSRYASGTYLMHMERSGAVHTIRVVVQ